jgi:hypothetical protein
LISIGFRRVSSNTGLVGSSSISSFHVSSGNISSVLLMWNCLSSSRTIKFSDALGC